MLSIRSKISVLLVFAILISCLLIGIIGVFAIRDVENRSSEEKLLLICKNCVYAIDEYLNSIEQSVDLISSYAQESLSSIELADGNAVGLNGLGSVEKTDEDFASPRQQALDTYLHGYLQSVETVFRSVASHINGVAAFYYRINPELSREAQGFLYSGIGRVSGFARTELTPLELYAEDDDAHVAWYYRPLRRGVPTWLLPYDNDNLDLRMISYVTPIYASGSFVGVIGMDINYNTLISQIQDIRVFNSGFVCLTDSNGNIIYHPDLPYGSSIASNDAGMSEAVHLMQLQDSSSRMVRFAVNGHEKFMAFGTLRNGMKLIVSVPVGELNANWTLLAQRVMIAAILILSLFATAASYAMNRLFRPLVSLTEASRCLSEGNYDVELDYKGDDEAGTLTRAFQQLVEHLRIYINDLNSRAYQDAMTGVKNKGAYEAMAHRLNAELSVAPKHSSPELALVMLDCNDLKRINDIHGHEQGDSYLRTSCALICKVFPHSPVFRFGGDEFIVILQSGAFHDREELMREFDREAERVNAAAKQPWERVSIAKGMAAFDPATDTTLDEVLARADAAMYEDKRRIKAAQGRDVNDR